MDTLTEIQYVQPLDTDNNPTGPVRWFCEDHMKAGFIFLDTPADDLIVAQSLDQSFETEFLKTRDQILKSGEMLFIFEIDLSTMQPQPNFKGQVQ